MTGNTSVLDTSVPTDSEAVFPTYMGKQINGYYTRCLEKATELFHQLNESDHSYKIHVYSRNAFFHELGLRPWFYVCWEHIPSSVADWRISHFLKYQK